MIGLSNNCFLVESASDLPDLPSSIEMLYLDLETSSGDSSIESLNPWKVDHCRAHLAAITWDNNPKCFAIPRQYLGEFVAQALKRARNWVNQNVKYDVHVLHNDLSIDFTGVLQCTLNLAKLVDADRTYKGGYGLDALCLDYIDVDLSYYYNSLKPWLRGNKDYGLIPLHVLGDYACNQVQANRKLYAKLEQELPDETSNVWETEKKLTTVLVKMERRGMKINVQGVKIEMLKALHKMAKLRQQLEDMIGYDFNPKSPTDCLDLFINRYGLTPVYKEKTVQGIVVQVSKGPTFDGDTLDGYLQATEPGSQLCDIVTKTLEYRKQFTMESLFWRPWLELHIDGVLHSDNNQNVRSGRMSCSMPNNQQFNDEARALVEPREGHVLTCHDYSQIEYRFIVHYIRNKQAIDAYNLDPNTDWHQYVADELGITRDPAKTLNFAISYGMGKAKTIGDLMHQKDMIKIYGNDATLLRQAALRCHRRLHERLPELRPNARMAENAARINGYARNAYGRRCHLPLFAAHIAFNRVCQSHAADLIKERTVALHESLPDYNAFILAMVHDEVVSEVPRDYAEKYMAKASETLNQSSVFVRVPIRCSAGISEKNWLVAKKGGNKECQEPWWIHRSHHKHSPYSSHSVP